MFKTSGVKNYNFYVAMEPKADAAFAACIDTKANGQMVKYFKTKDYSGYEIRHVNGAEMLRLMKNYRAIQAAENIRKHSEQQ